jgi:hypothetical protein
VIGRRRTVACNEGLSRAMRAQEKGNHLSEGEGRMSSDHSCHAGCQKPPCMLRREKDLREENAQLRATNARLELRIKELEECLRKQNL